MKKDTQNGFSYADQASFYGDFPTAYIDAHYRNGQFYDCKTGQAVALREEAPVRLIVRRMDIPEADRVRFRSTAEKVLARGEVLRFQLPYQSGTLAYTELTFRVRLLEDLVFEKKGNKPARAINVACEVFERAGSHVLTFRPFAVESLNQAYFQASVCHRPEARSHVTNIYQKFYIDGTDRTLESLRF